MKGNATSYRSREQEIVPFIKTDERNEMSSFFQRVDKGLRLDFIQYHLLQ